jgi:hypothetical protein
MGNSTGRDFGKVFSVVFLGMAEILESVYKFSRQVC